MLLGQVVDGRYRIEECVATGGMGAVYRAQHVGLGKVVALKFLRGDLRQDPTLAKRLRREAIAVSKLRDQHTISVFDFGVWNGLAFLVMEYLVGEDLGAALTRDRQLPVGRVIGIAAQVCQSLVEAHEAGVIHRDLKPENIFLVRGSAGLESVRVLDFGLAKLVDGENDDGRFHTQDGAILGTPYYMAPEQVTANQIDGRTDLYALGVVLYRSVSGALPFTGESPADIFYKLKNGTALKPSVHENCPDLDAAFENLIMQMLSRTPAERPASAREVLTALQALMSQGDQTFTKQKNTRTADGSEHVAASGQFELGEALGPASEPAWADPRTDASDRGSWSDATWDVMRRDDSLALEEKFFAPLESDSHSDSEGWETLDELSSGYDDADYEGKLRQGGLSKILYLCFLLAAGVAVGVWYGQQPKMEFTDHEVEPNETSATATRIKVSSPITGVLGFRADPKKSDQDMYRLDGPFKSASFRLEVTRVPNMDIVVDVLDFAGASLRTINRGAAGEGETDTFSVTDVRGLQIRVRELWTQSKAPTENSTDRYRLSIERSDPASPRSKSNP